MILLVCGGRDYRDRERLETVLGRILAIKGIEILIEGGAAGADSMAARWAKANGIKVETHAAKWEKHNKSAGRIRNSVMQCRLAYYKATGAEVGAVAFAGGKGTSHMVSLLRTSGIKVMEVS